VRKPSAQRSPRDLRLVEGVISRLPLLHSASPAQRAALAPQCWTLLASRGDTLARRGEPLPGVLALAYGSVKLSLRNAENEERVLRLVSAGQSFGEATALLALPCQFEALALAESKLVVLPPAVLFGLVERDPRIARGILTTLAEGTVQLLSEMESATLRRSSQRLAAYLDSLAGPAAVPGPRTVQLPASKTLIAARLGIAQETLSRLLRRLADEGMIAVSRREITILDGAGLAKRANGSLTG
jgi:CRP/FNR family transcriptional regulator, dissimilatory nitrate respiration regulator